LHGINGEDGSIQGVLEMMQIPYTGSGILASAIGMNKAFQKEILSTTSYNKTAFYCIKRKDWSKENHAIFLNKTLQEIGQHYVVRPANQGSSIGVSILNGKDEVDFVKAVDLAFFITSISLKDWQSKSESEKLEWIRDLIDIKGGIGLPLKMLDKTISHPDDLLDSINHYFKTNTQNLTLESVYEENEVVVESFIEGREFSCVVIENENGEPIALPPTEIVKTKEVYDYRSKYLPGLSRKVTPIDLPNAAIQHIRKECEGLYQLLRFNVYARIDGFYKPDGTVVLNDPNTTSGMLPSSFFFHQAAEIGLNPSQFISYIIDASLRARMAQGGNVSNYRNLLNRLTKLLAQQNQHQNEKLRVGVILGGYSSERHISVESGRNIYEKLSSSIKYEPIPIFLSEEDGKMRLHQIPIHLMLKDNADDIKAKLEVHSTHDIIDEIRKSSASIIHTFGVKAYQFYPSEIKMEALADIVDAVFIAIHGRPGEDGTLQTELDKLGIPYNGSPPPSASTTIDKYQTKAILRANGFLVANDLLIHKADWEKDASNEIRKLEQTLHFPVIAKPVDDGCSSAVKKIDSISEFQHFASAMFREKEEISAALEQALGLKHKEEFPQKEVILVEELIESKGAAHFLEITGGMLTHIGQSQLVEFEAFEPSEALAGSAILSLEEKFLAGQGQNITPARFSNQPEIRAKISKKVQEDLVRAAKILGVEGYCRIDAFVRIFDENHVETIIIEVNSLPGMTPATCIFHQAAINGYQPINFIDEILTYALEKKKNK
jgi:UDP-N-acetylmuramate--alanine ligase